MSQQSLPLSSPRPDGARGASPSTQTDAEPSLLAGIEGLLARHLRALEKLVSEHLFVAEDREELEECIGELLRDRTYQRYLLDLQRVLTVVTSQPRNDSEDEEDGDALADELLEGAGHERVDLLRECVALSEAIAEARRQIQEQIPHALNHVWSDAQSEQLKDFSRQPPLWFLRDPRVPAVFKRSWYGAFVADACGFAVAAARHGGASSWQVQALLEIWRTSARQYLGFLVATPGVQRPEWLNPAEVLDLGSILHLHQEAERGYQQRLAQARATDADVFPPVTGGDDV